jgi:hypothetical protein
LEEEEEDVGGVEGGVNWGMMEREVDSKIS